MREGRSQIQCNPLVVHGVLYATSPQLKVLALDAATGARKWVFDPFTSGADVSSLGVNRGLVFWEEGTDQRILVASGQRLYALDAKTGTPIPSFGDKGSVNLRDGLGRDASKLYVLSNTPGAIYKDLLIIGTRDPRARALVAGRHPRLRRAHRQDPLDRSTPFRGRASSATTRGQPTPTRASAARTRGAASRSTRREASCSCPRARRPSTSGAAIASARTCSPTACSR